MISPFACCCYVFSYYVSYLYYYLLNFNSTQASLVFCLFLCDFITLSSSLFRDSIFLLKIRKVEKRLKYIKKKDKQVKEKTNKWKKDKIARDITRTRTLVSRRTQKRGWMVCVCARARRALVTGQLQVLEGCGVWSSVPALSVIVSLPWFNVFDCSTIYNTWSQATVDVFNHALPRQSVTMFSIQTAGGGGSGTLCVNITQSAYNKTRVRALLAAKRRAPTLLSQNLQSVYYFLSF